MNCPKCKDSTLMTIVWIQVTVPGLHPPITKTLLKSKQSSIGFADWKGSTVICAACRWSASYENLFREKGSTSEPTTTS